MPSAKTEFFLTPQGRFCWPYLDQPRTTDMVGKTLDEPKYEVVLYIPKTSADRNQDRAFLALSQKVMEVVLQQFRGQWPQISPRGEWLDWPIDDCDADAAGLEKAPWGRGCWRIRLSGGKFPPKVVDGGNNDLRQFIGINGQFRDGVFKGGDYGIASVNCYGWEFSNVKKGVSFGLEGVKKTADGDPIGGGGRSANEIFGAPTGQPQPAYGAGRLRLCRRARGTAWRRPPDRSTRLLRRAGMPHRQRRRSRWAVRTQATRRPQRRSMGALRRFREATRLRPPPTLRPRRRAGCRQPLRSRVLQSARDECALFATTKRALKSPSSTSARAVMRPTLRRRFFASAGASTTSRRKSRFW